MSRVFAAETSELINPLDKESEAIVMDIASSLKRHSIETHPEVLEKAIKGVLTGQEKQSTEKAAKKH